MSSVSWSCQVSESVWLRSSYSLPPFVCELQLPPRQLRPWMEVCCPQATGTGQGGCWRKIVLWLQDESMNEVLLATCTAFLIPLLMLTQVRSSSDKSLRICTDSKMSILVQDMLLLLQLSLWVLRLWYWVLLLHSPVQRDESCVHWSFRPLWSILLPLQLHIS